MILKRQKISRRSAGLRGEKSMKKFISKITIKLFDGFIVPGVCEQFVREY